MFFDYHISTVRVQPHISSLTVCLSRIFFHGDTAGQRFQILYCMVFHGKISVDFMKIPRKILHGIPRGQKRKNSMRIRRVLW